MTAAAAVPTRRPGRPAVWLPGLVVAALAIGCATVPSSHKAWLLSLDDGRRLAGGGNAVAADSVMSAFAARYPGSPEAAEAMYWRAVFLLDSGAVESSAAAIPTLRSYLTSPSPQTHMAEATAMLHAAVQSQQMNAFASSAAARAVAASTAADEAAKRANEAAARVGAALENARAATDTVRVQAGEIARLKDSLVKSNLELDRIKKRLGDATKRVGGGG